ncbi:MAG: hypothetical protein ACRDKT_09695 [Actinomycetota bacterium]
MEPTLGRSVGHMLPDIKIKGRSNPYSTTPEEQASLERRNAFLMLAQGEDPEVVAALYPAISLCRWCGNDRHPDRRTCGDPECIRAAASAGGRKPTTEDTRRRMAEGARRRWADPVRRAQAIEAMKLAAARRCEQRFAVKKS